MKCDYCNCNLTPGNYAGSAPGGIPITVCKTCYDKLKSEAAKSSKDADNGGLND